MTGEALARTLPRALLILRVTLGLFLLQWGVEKFLVPQNTVLIWGYFYGLNVPPVASCFFGVAEIAIAICLFLGLYRTISYGAALALPAVRVVVSRRRPFDPGREQATLPFKL